MKRAIAAHKVVSMKFNEVEALIREGARETRGGIALAALEQATKAAAIANEIVISQMYSRGLARTVGTDSELDEICAQINILDQESRARDERSLKLLEEVERSSTTPTRPALNQNNKTSDR